MTAAPGEVKRGLVFLLAAAGRPPIEPRVSIEASKTDAPSPTTSTPTPTEIDIHASSIFRQGVCPRGIFFPAISGAISAEEVDDVAAEVAAPCRTIFGP